MDNSKPAPALGIFLLFFLLTPVDPKCTRLTAVECKAAQLAASHFDEARIGFDMVGLGIDLTTMENAQGMVLDMNSWEDTDGSCTLCMNTLLDGNSGQFLPLAISEWHITEGSWINENYSLALSVEGLARKEYSYTNHEWMEDLDLIMESSNPMTQGNPNSYRKYYFVGTRSKNMKFARERTTNDKDINFFPYEIGFRKYRVHTRENPPISEALKESLKKLPQDNTLETRDKYIDLIRIYGTHYVVEAELGGYLKYLVGIRYCKLSMAGFNWYKFNECVENGIRSALGMSTNNDPTCVMFRNLTDCTSNTQGGNRNIDLCQMGGTAENYERWQKELRVSPGLIHTKLLPIHFLLDWQDPQRPLLRDAIHRYIYGGSMQLACTNKCTSGYTYDIQIACSCRCDHDGFSTFQCCPTQIGISRVVVWIDSAWDLRGDWLSGADTDVEVELFGRTFRTYYVWNNNNPGFHTRFNFGIVPLVHGVNRLYIRVKEWNPQPFGETITDSFAVEIGAGEVQQKVQALSHGYLKFRYQVVCGPLLTGYNCREYVAQKPTYFNNFMNF